MNESQAIFNEITRAQSILLHCHPSPDPDSLGSVLATKYALESIGKKVTAIRGDSETPPAFMHFPGAESILEKNFSEIDPQEFDLFIILDSGSPEMISRSAPPALPLPMRSITIDHHASNKGYADLNYLHPAPSTTYLLYGLFKEWGITLTPEIAANLFIGLYTDTGGFKFPPTDYKVFEVAVELTRLYPDFPALISKMENSQKEDFVRGMAVALSSIQTFENHTIALAAVSHEALSQKNISTNAISEGYISNLLKSVIGWNIAACLVEIEPGRIKASFRTRDADKYPVFELATALGGGGHRAAAGANLLMPLPEAVKKVVETAKVIYNL